MPENSHLLLIPGLVCDEALWRHQADALSDIADVRITDQHTGYPTMNAIAEAIVSAAPPQFALAGLSMGGYIAFEIMEHWPERVSKLAILDSSARADTTERKKGRLQMVAVVKKEGNLDEIVSSMLPLFVHPDRLNEPSLVAEITAMVQRVGIDNYIRQMHAIMSRSHQVPSLSKIACPTSVICGREDILTPVELSEEIAGEIQGAELHVIENCGHLTTMERPEAVTAIMRDWLTAS